MKIDEIFRAGLYYHQIGSFEEAKAAYLKVLQINAKHFDAIHLLGMIAFQLKDYFLAINYISKALKIFERSELAHCNLGNVYSAINQFDKALFHYDKSIFIKSDHFEAHFNRATTLKFLNRFNEALKGFQMALAIMPNSHLVYLNLGVLLSNQRKLLIANDSFEKAIKINPFFAEAYSNLGVNLKELGLIEKALKYYDFAIAIRPEFKESHSNRGVALQEFKKMNHAINAITNSLLIDPNDAQSHFNLALCLLRSCDFQNGFNEFEWRWKSPSSSCFNSKREFAKPLWLGQSSLTDKSILIHAEQGLGDSIQFVRYLELLVEHGAKVIFEVQSPLVEFFKQIKGVQQIVERGDHLPDFDFQCPLMSLPLAFNTSLQTIPKKDYYLASDTLKRQFWSQKLYKSNKPKVGLVWSGNSAHSNDSQRSLELSKLYPYLPDRFDYVSLQKEVRASDYEYLCNSNIQHFEEEIEDFTDTAALCSLMDLVICVDTSVAHLSAALGRATWILLPFVPDWRWLLDRDDSPWYPTVKLIRQHSRGDWAGALSSMQESLSYF